MSTLFLYLFRFFEKHKIVLAILVLAILGISGWYASRLKL
jgi:hypothetical protein